MINFPTPTALNEPFVSPDGRRWFWNGVAWQAQAKQLALAEIADFPTAPQTGTKVLQVNNGTVAWVDPAEGSGSGGISDAALAEIDANEMVIRWDYGNLAAPRRNICRKAKRS